MLLAISFVKFLFKSVPIFLLDIFFHFPKRIKM